MRFTTLNEFICNKYKLDTNEIHYTQKGKITPLPPKAKVMYNKLYNEIQIKQENNFEYTASLGKFTCQIPSKNMNPGDIPFPEQAFSDACNKPNQSFHVRGLRYIRKTLQKIKMSLKMFFLYSLSEHFLAYLHIAVIPAITLTTASTILYLLGQLSIDPWKSASASFKIFLGLSAIAYPFVWEKAISIIYRPIKNRPYRTDHKTCQPKETITIKEETEKQKKELENLSQIANNKEQENANLVNEIEKQSQEIKTLTQKIKSLEQENEELESRNKNLLDLKDSRKKPKIDIRTLETLRKLVSVLVLLCCEMAKGNHQILPSKNNKTCSTIRAIIQFCNQLQTETPREMRGLSSNNVADTLKECFTFVFQQLGLDPRRIHKNYDESSTLLKSSNKKLKQS